MKSLTAPALIAACLLLAGTATSAAAQSDPRLVQAVALAQDGGRDSALSLVNAIQQSAAPGSALAAEALYTAGILATNPDTMRRILQQVVVEQSLSPWADDALLRLAQLDYASGNLPAAMRDLERFRTDFPGSDVFTTAAFWAARTYFDARQERQACTWVGMGIARDDSLNPSVTDQLQLFARRCSAASLAEGSAKAPPRPPKDVIALALADSQAGGQVDTVTAPATPDTTVVSQAPSPAPAPVPAVPAPRPVTPEPGVLVARLDTTPAAPRPAVTQPSLSRGPVFRVQVVAANTQAAADAATRRLRDLGYEARIVSEGGYFKVRAGAYTSRADAADAIRKLRPDFPGAFLVTDP